MIQISRSLYWVARRLRHGIRLQMACGPEKLLLSILVSRTGQVICLTTCSWNMMMKLLRKLEECIRYILSLQRRCSRFLTQI
nr:MAG TPA: hypothetical protein [Caudoviricetes sp.]